MTDEAAIRRLLLEDGLEDLIPLREAAESCRHEDLIHGEDEQSLRVLMQALVNLFHEKKIQLWVGPTMEDEQLVDEADVEGLLRDPANYQWASGEDMDRTVSYVNVENLYVEPDSH